MVMTLLNGSPYKLRKRPFPDFCLSDYCAKFMNDCANRCIKKTMNPTKISTFNRDMITISAPFESAYERSVHKARLQSTTYIGGGIVNDAT